MQIERAGHQEHWFLVTIDHRGQSHDLQNGTCSDLHYVVKQSRRAYKPHITLGACLDFFYLNIIHTDMSLHRQSLLRSLSSS